MKPNYIHSRTRGSLRLWAFVAVALLLIVPALPALGASREERASATAEHGKGGGQAKGGPNAAAEEEDTSTPEAPPPVEEEPPADDASGGGDSSSSGGGDSTPDTSSPPPDEPASEPESDGGDPPSDPGGDQPSAPDDDTAAGGEDGDGGDGGGDTPDGTDSAAPRSVGRSSASDGSDGTLENVSLDAAAAAAVAPAAAGGQKARGAVKVNGLNFTQFPRNDPHVGCVFDVNFFNYPPGTANVRFEAWPPTAPGVFLTGGNVTLGPPQALGWVGGDTFDLTAALAAFVPHPVQGFHVKLFVDTGGKTIKHKVFWVQCAPAPPAVPGELLVTKAVEGDAPVDAEFDYTVTGPNGYNVAFTLPQPGDVWEWTDDVPAGDYVVTETGTFGADTTHVSVNGGQPVEATAATGTVPAGGLATIDFVNDFGVLPIPGANGELVVTKEVEGDDAPVDPAYEFTVTGPGFTETFTLPTPGGDWTWSEFLPPGEYEVTETGWEGDPVTFVSVNGGPDSEATAATVELVPNDTETVAFVNNYGNTIVLDRPPIEADRNPPEPKDLPPPDEPDLPATGIAAVLLAQGALLAMAVGGVAVRTSRKRVRVTPWLQP